MCWCVACFSPMEKYFNVYLNKYSYIWYTNLVYQILILIENTLNMCENGYDDRYFS